jgi:hypothetical protein
VQIGPSESLHISISFGKPEVISTLQNYEMQEELEQESLDCLRKDVAVELADKYQGDEVRPDIDTFRFFQA